MAEIQQLGTSVTTSRTVIAEFATHKEPLVNFEVHNAGDTNALNLLELETQEGQGASWHVAIANAGWVAPDGKVLIASTGAMTLAAGARGSAWLNLNAAYAARLVATVAANTTTVNVRGAQGGN